MGFFNSSKDFFNTLGNVGKAAAPLALGVATGGWGMSDPQMLALLGQGLNMAGSSQSSNDAAKQQANALSAQQGTNNQYLQLLQQAMNTEQNYGNQAIDQYKQGWLQQLQQAQQNQGIDQAALNKAQEAGLAAGNLGYQGQMQNYNLQTQLMNQMSANQAPQRQAQQAGLGIQPYLQALMGLPSSVTSQQLSGVLNSNPMADWQQQQMEKSMNRQGAARGMLNSTQTMNQIMQGTNELSNQNMNNIWSRLSGMYNNAANMNLTDPGQAFSGQLGNSLSNLGANYAQMPGLYSKTANVDPSIYGNYGNEMAKLLSGMGTQMSNNLASYGKQQSIGNTQTNGMAASQPQQQNWMQQLSGLLGSSGIQDLFKNQGVTGNTSAYDGVDFNSPTNTIPGYKKWQLT